MACNQCECQKGGQKKNRKSKQKRKKGGSVAGGSVVSDWMDDVSIKGPFITRHCDLVNEEIDRIRKRFIEECESRGLKSWAEVSKDWESRGVFDEIRDILQEGILTRKGLLIKEGVLTFEQMVGVLFDCYRMGYRRGYGEGFCEGGRNVRRAERALRKSLDAHKDWERKWSALSFLEWGTEDVWENMKKSVKGNIGDVGGKDKDDVGNKEV